MNTQKELLTLAAGEQFLYGGQTWIKLDDDENGGTLAITAEIVEDRAFDNDNNNNWSKSTARRYLNPCEGERGFFDQLLDNGAKLEDFIEIVSDLTADNGQRDYGTATDLIALLSDNLFRHYRDLLLLEDGGWYWTLTPLGCNAADSRFVRLVGSGGVLSSSFAWSETLGLRPLCKLKSEIFVSTAKQRAGSGGGSL